MPSLLPRTIRGQLIGSIILLQCLLIALFVTLLLSNERSFIHRRTQSRIEYQTHLISEAATLAFTEHADNEMLQFLDVIRTAPSMRAVRITDLAGNTLAYEDRTGRRQGPPLTDREFDFLHQALASSANQVRQFTIGGKTISLAPVVYNGQRVAIAWAYPSQGIDQPELANLIQLALTYSLLTLLGNALMALLLARNISVPVNTLLRATRELARDPEVKNVFPIAATTRNEVGDLTEAFNRMVTSLNEQRAGLNETLALLDSLLAAAPIGFCFFDRQLRYVRMNQFLADINGLPISSQIGRKMSEILPGELATSVERVLTQVFETGTSVQDLETNGIMPTDPESQRSWLVSYYPVKTANNYVRWVGAIVVEITERRRSEEALRRTEKLAAAGRLAASIAHEINNPLEAITNLLYLLRQQPSLDQEAVEFAEQAQHEVARVSHITQQTLRFYRQSSQPSLSSIPDLLDSVLSLYKGRVTPGRIQVIRRYSGSPSLFAFSGELRQLFANLVGNALDAMPGGGTLALCARESRDWRNPHIRGIRVVVCDTGIGMTTDVRRRIFEAFFTTKEATGTGLGLWVSAEIIEKHSGTVRVRSRARTSGKPGQCSGTCFMLFFPEAGVVRPEQPVPMEAATVV